VEPERASLYLFPPTNNQLFPVLGPGGELSILDWNETHAAIRTLRLAAPQSVDPTEIIDAPPWADVLLASRNDTREIPLAFAGEHHGHRTACVAFDWPTEGVLSADHVNLLLFFSTSSTGSRRPTAPVTVLRTGDVHTIADLPQTHGSW